MNHKLSALRLALAAWFWCVTSGIAMAHHSFATFDQDKSTVLDGTIKAVEWANPHIWIWITVTDSAGKTVDWGVEGAPPNVLSRSGWRPNTFKRGDPAKITVHPLKSGMPGGSLIQAVKADGTVLNARGAQSVANSGGEPPR